MSSPTTVDLSRPTEATAREVDRVCRETGFLAITGHGVSAALCEEMWEVSRAFFDLPLERKMRVAMPHPGSPYGYSPVAGEALARSRGEATPPDPKETLSIGPEATWNETGGEARTLWPDEPAELPRIWRAYFLSMGRLASRILSLFARSLRLPPDFFEASIEGHGSALRALRYPALDVAPDSGRLRAGAHSDYGSITILRTEPGSRGLEIRTPSGRWEELVVPGDALLVNVGDLLARWSNDRWVSTLHRVSLAEPARSRESIAFFHLPHPGAVIACMPTCLAEGEAPRYPPVRAGEYLMSKFRSTVVENVP